MSMLQIAKFLQINGSVDRLGQQKRWFSLPGDGWLARGRRREFPPMAPEFLVQLNSGQRDLDSVRSRDAGSAVLS